MRTNKQKQQNTNFFIVVLNFQQMTKTRFFQDILVSIGTWCECRINVNVITTVTADSKFICIICSNASVGMAQNLERQNYTNVAIWIHNNLCVDSVEVIVSRIELFLWLIHWSQYMYFVCYSIHCTNCEIQFIPAATFTMPLIYDWLSDIIRKCCVKSMY
jgi:hypothetical protein